MQSVDLRFDLSYVIPVMSEKENDQQAWHVFVSSDGFEILVGRTDLDNDRLTFSRAGQNDFWLHVAQSAGSHVVVPNPNNLPRLPKTTLRQAAALAVYFSKSRHGGKTAVNYTRIRFVKKQPRAKAGQVSISRFQTILVRANERPNNSA